MNKTLHSMWATIALFLVLSVIQAETNTDSIEMEVGNAYLRKDMSGRGWLSFESPDDDGYITLYIRPMQSTIVVDDKYLDLEDTYRRKHVQGVVTFHPESGIIEEATLYSDRYLKRHEAKQRREALRAHSLR